MAKSPVSPLSLPYEKVTLDRISLENFTKDSGPIFVHYKATPCPIGQVEKESIRSPHAEHSECSNGFIYEKAGEFSGPFTSNAASLQLTDIGLVDGSTSIVTLPRFYNDTQEQIYINPYDRLYIKDNVVLSVFAEKIESSISGVDRATFPIERVESVIDNKGKKYSQDIHFNLVNGNIVWLSDNRPGYDVSLGKGTLYSVRYLYIPFYYVSRLLHEIRIIAFADLDGNIKYDRGPYQIAIVREKFFAKQQNVEGQEPTQSTVVAPGYGLFGVK